MKKVELSWNVMLHDFNADKIVKYDVLKNNDYLVDRIKKAIKKGEVTRYDELKELVTHILRATYWSRAEYEILVSGVYTKSEPQKIDIWYQVEMNLDNLIEYLINKLNLNLI